MIDTIVGKARIWPVANQSVETENSRSYWGEIAVPVHELPSFDIPTMYAEVCAFSLLFSQRDFTLI